MDGARRGVGPRRTQLTGPFFVLVCLGIRNRAREASDLATADFAQKVASGSVIVAVAVVGMISLGGPAALVTLVVLAVALVVLIASMVLLFTRADAPMSRRQDVNHPGRDPPNTTKAGARHGFGVPASSFGTQS